MSRRNPVLQLATRLVREEWSREQFADEVGAVMDEGATLDELYEALRDAIQPRSPTPYLEAVVRICVFICSHSDPELAARALLEAGCEVSTRFDDDSLSLAVHYFQQARRFISPDHELYGHPFLKESVARCRLAELGVDPLENSVAAVKLSRQSRSHFDPNSPQCAEAYMVEGTARCLRAELGRATRRNLQRAFPLYQQARRLFDQTEPDSYNSGVVRLHEGNTRCKAAELGINPIGNLRKAIRRYAEIRSRWTRQQFAIVQVNAAGALVRLAELGVRPAQNLGKAVTLLRRCRERLDVSNPEYHYQYGRSEANEAVARQALADLAVAPLYNLRVSIGLLEEARTRYDAETPDWGKAAGNEALGRLNLHDWEQGGDRNLQMALQRCVEARRCFPELAPDYRKILAIEGEVRWRLAMRGHDTSKNVQLSMASLEAAIAGLSEESHVHQLLILKKAEALQELASMGIDPKANLEAAITLCDQVRDRADVESVLYRNALGTKAVIHGHLARKRISPESNWESAAELAREAAEKNPVGTPSWAELVGLQARALRALGRVEQAYRCLDEALGGVEAARSRLLHEQERLAFLERMSDLYETMVAICMELAAVSDCQERKEQLLWESWHRVHRAKSRILLELLTNVRPRLADSDRGLWDDFVRLENLSALRLREAEWVRRRLSGEHDGIPEQLQSTAQERLKVLDEEQQRLQKEYERKREQIFETIEGMRTLHAVGVPSPREVVQAFRVLSGVQTEGGTPGPFASDAGPRPLLIEFFLLYHSDEVVVFLMPLWKDDAPHVERLKLEPRGAINLANSFYGAVSTKAKETVTHPGQETSSRDCEWQRLLDGIGALLRPLEPHLPVWRPTELVVSPHSLLSLLPLHAGTLNGEPLVEQFPVAYVPSPGLAPEIVRQMKPVHGTALLVGNPTGDLPGSEGEMASVARRLHKAGVETKILLQAEATTQSVISGAASASLVHFACHSDLDPEDFMRSGVELADRRLTVIDIATELELKKACVVYLNSCSSGKVVPRIMDELLSLVRVFLYAGTPTVLATLFPTRDDAAYLFGDCFYRNWIEDGTSPGVAFQRAMKETRELYPDPSAWAPFVLVGAWRNPR